MNSYSAVVAARTTIQCSRSLSGLLSSRPSRSRHLTKITKPHPPNARVFHAFFKPTSRKGSSRLQISYSQAPYRARARTMASYPSNSTAEDDASIASLSFLSELQSLYPSSTSERNPWHIIAAVSYCASNRPEGVPEVLKCALRDVKAKEGGHEERLRVVREIRDGLFKAGLICGYSRVSAIVLVTSRGAPN